MNSFDDSLRKKLVSYLKEEPDEALRSEITSLEKDPKMWDELSDRLNKHLSFGTAGLRGQMESGYNRMNSVTVYRFAYALGSEIQSSLPNSPVVVGFDARLKSHQFADEVIDILNRMSIPTFSFDQSVPTPLCAFATKHLKARFGVMITASHNPGCDNGIKVFDSSSCQLHGDILKSIEQKMSLAPLRQEFIDNISAVKGLSRKIDITAIDAYFSQIQTTQLLPRDEIDTSLQIVYTPLHGVGRDFTLRALRENRFNNVHVVKVQGEPNGHFPTVPFPNPEEEHALDLAHDEAKKLECSWVFANDPDADRLQVSCLDRNGEFRKLTGNETGIILGYFAIEKALRTGLKPLVASSIVSSRMLGSIAQSLGALYVDGLTGFSNIASAALRAEQETGGTFVFGYEEAIGFLVGKVVLDKDGVNSAVRFMEIAAYLKKKNISVWDFLNQLYMRFGLFSNSQWSMRFAGIEALHNMALVMKKIRSLSEHDIALLFGGSGWRKYDLSEAQQSGPYSGISADVIIFEISGLSRLIVRPSGTEPKIKFYMEIVDHSSDEQSLEAKKMLLNSELVTYREKIEKILA